MATGALTPEVSASQSSNLSKEESGSNTVGNAVLVPQTSSMPDTSGVKAAEGGKYPTKYCQRDDFGSHLDENWLHSSNAAAPSTDSDVDVSVTSADTVRQSRMSDYLPVAYSFLGSEEAVRERLSSNLHVNPSKAHQGPEGASQSVSTWSSKQPQIQKGGDPPGSLHASMEESPSRTAAIDASQIFPNHEQQDNYRYPVNFNQANSGASTMERRAPPAKLPTDSNDRETPATVRPVPEPSRSSGNMSAFSDLSNTGSTHFGPGLRVKLNTVLPLLLNTVPIGPSRTIMIAEYGCMNSRAIHLLRTVLEHLSSMAFAGKPQSMMTDPQGHALCQPPHRASMAGFTRETADVINFVVLHEDISQSDFRWFQQVLDTHSDSYLDPLWQSSQKPPLQNAIFSACVARPFGSRIVPPDSLNIGFSLMDLHWTHSPATGISLPTIAHAELTMCLNARAREFRRGGVFVLAYIARTEEAVCESNLERPQTPTDNLQDSKARAFRSTLSPAAISEQDASLQTGSTSPCSEKLPRDIWTAMSDMIVPCLQRLVSCGMMKIDVARSMLTLPMHPRTSYQTLRVLEKFSDVWALDWSCGLGRSETREITTDFGEVVSLQSEPETLRLPQPAWMALKSGKIPAAAYNDHVINMFKNLYETHFRQVLRERGKLNKGAVEFILDTLWDVLRSRMGDPNTCPLADCELEVQLFALRRL